MRWSELVTSVVRSPSQGASGLACDGNMLRYLLLAANILVWGFFAWSGRGETPAHAPYYENLPVAMLIASTILATALLWMRQIKSTA